jgi:hypothetical protein
MDFLHNDRIAATLDEVKTVAQQLQVTTAAAHELIANANALLDKLTLIVDAISRAGKP